MQTQFGFVLLFFIAGLLLVFATISIASFLRKDKPNIEKNASYESGEQTEGPSQVAFNIKFYVVAVIFLLFEVEILMLFPWAVVFSDKKALANTQGAWAYYAGFEILIFVGMLALGLAYCWKKGYLDWIKTQEKSLKTESPVPAEDYATLNEKYR
jgi:NADH-quinone oxidoreductase subunit A